MKELEGKRTLSQGSYVRVRPTVPTPPQNASRQTISSGARTRTYPNFMSRVLGTQINPTFPLLWVGKKYSICIVLLERTYLIKSSIFRVWITKNLLTQVTADTLVTSSKWDDGADLIGAWDLASRIIYSRSIL